MEETFKIIWFLLCLLRFSFGESTNYTETPQCLAEEVACNATCFVAWEERKAHKKNPTQKFNSTISKEERKACHKCEVDAGCKWPKGHSKSNHKLNETKNNKNKHDKKKKKEKSKKLKNKQVEQNEQNEQNKKNKKNETNSKTNHEVKKRPHKKTKSVETTSAVPSST